MSCAVPKSGQDQKHDMPVNIGGIKGSKLSVLRQGIQNTNSDYAGEAMEQMVRFKDTFVSLSARKPGSRA